jgi:hypothetical protein
MDTDRSPGVGPLTWGTLGLLAVSWVLLASEVVRALARPGGVASLRDDVGWIILLALGAHVICGLAVWCGRRHLAVGIPAYLLALLYAVLSGLDFLIAFRTATARDLGLADVRLVPWAYYAWGAAWVAGLPALIWLARRARGGPRADGG